MIVDVNWGGVSLARGASARAEEGGWFVELEQPMPVGTRLQLAGEIVADVEVARVHEGAGAGMVVKQAGATRDAAATEPAAAAASDEAGDDKEPEKDNGGGGSKKERRRKRR